LPCELGFPLSLSFRARPPATGREIEVSDHVGVKAPLGFVVAFSGAFDVSKDALAEVVSQEVRGREITLGHIRISIECFSVGCTVGVANHKVINTVVVL
jgi:hypothetical protein